MTSGIMYGEYIGVRNTFTEISTMWLINLNIIVHLCIVQV